MRRWAVRVLLLATAVSALATGVVAFRLWSALPRTHGAVKVSGLSSPVEILRDEFGIPHIRAATEADVMFGQGYVHAQDRLWQMEFQRRLGAGRLAEFLGRPALPTDRLFRTLGLYRAASAAWGSLSPDARLLLEAYIAGINAFIASHRGRSLPFEFSLFGIAPEPWTPADVLVWPKVMALVLSTNFRDELLRARVTARIGPAGAAALMPAWGDGWPVIVPEGLDPAPAADPGPGLLAKPVSRVVPHLEAAAIARLASMVPTSPFAVSTPAASNNWVVSGARTASGRPLLANDPHLAARLPSTWYLVHLEGGRINAIGASLPGSPGVVIGHNARIAWGLTNLMTDVQDLYVERLNARGEAEYEGGFEPVRVVHESIKVRGERDVPIAISHTRHGPVITDALENGPAEALALEWVALEEQDSTFEAFLGVLTAANWGEFTAAVSRYRVPIQNWVYADVDGNIGYIAPGAIPIRAAGDGTVPAPGWTGASEWTGFVPERQWPRSVNPSRGYLVTANNKALPDTYPYLISTNWEAGYRAQRISELIEAKPRLTPDDVAAIQADVTPPAVQTVLPWMLRAAVPEDQPLARALRDRLAGWDGALRPDSVEASIYMHWYRRLVRALFEDDLGESVWEDYGRLEHWHGKALHGLITSSDATWCDDRRTAAVESCEQILGASLVAAAADMRSEYRTGDTSRWTWGPANQVTFGHLPLDAVSGLRPFVSRRAEHHGNTFTVTPTMRIEGQTIISSYRQIVDLADFDNSRFVHPLGQSGQVLSRHFDDLHERWRRVEYVPMRFSKRAVDEATRERLRLEP
jgi:penicillin amidase